MCTNPRVCGSRIGIKEGSTMSILNHAYFDGLDLAAVRTCSLLPMYIPPPSVYNDPLFNLPGVKRFRGDQAVFDSF